MTLSPTPEARAALLRSAGLRVTPQRQLVIEIMEATPGRHLTADEIWQGVRDRYQSVNRSTVYRVLEVLSGVGAVQQTRLGSAVVHYELTGSDPAHHHLVCVRCRRITELAAADVGSLRKRLFDKHGFRLGLRDLTIEGLCRVCAAQEPA